MDSSVFSLQARSHVSRQEQRIYQYARVRIGETLAECFLIISL